MARSARSSKISPDEITIAHVWSQTVQQMFLLGKDEYSDKDYSHRKDWIIDIMAHQSMFMAVDILRFAIMDNHVHFLLRTRPDIVQGWSDEQVAWNYLKLCPKKKRRKKVNGKWEYEVVDPSECDIQLLVNDSKKMKKLRLKLSSLSFWMQLLKQKVSRRANSEVQKDGVSKGAFWKGRFEMTVIHTREYLLTCSAYIDLNPFRANMTDNLGGYRYTSICMQLRDAYSGMLGKGDLVPTDANPLGEFPESRMLCPIEFCEMDVLPEENSEKVGVSQGGNQQELVTQASEGGAVTAKKKNTVRSRCSDTGFLEITAQQYVDLLEWSIKQLKSDRAGKIVGLEHAVVSSHGMNQTVWNDRVMNFRRLCRHDAGVSRAKALRGFCGEPSAAVFLALREFVSEK